MEQASTAYWRYRNVVPDFVDLCKHKDVECLVLKRRATESYFADAAIKNVFGTSFRALGPYELLRDAEPHWGKSENWKVAGAMQLGEIEPTDFGAFLDQL